MKGGSTLQKDLFFPEAVALELARARQKFPAIQSLHEGYAVIQEELEEFWAEVKSKTTNNHLLLKELVQVAAMCQRVAEDVLKVKPC